MDLEGIWGSITCLVRLTPTKKAGDSWCDGWNSEDEKFEARDEEQYEEGSEEGEIRE